MGEDLLLPQMDGGLVLWGARDSLLQLLFKERRVSERPWVATSSS